MEPRKFGECVDDIVKHLQQAKAKWESIDCLGRPSQDGDREIRTTVLISFSVLPGEKETLSWKKKLKMLMPSGTSLPMEFVEGEVIE